MRQPATAATPSAPTGTYLNVILTVNAALLSAMVWMQLSGAWSTTALPLDSSASALQSPPDGGIPNAAAQRQRQIEELQAMRASLDTLKKTLDSGKMKVIVANADEIRAATDKGK
jgi:hypothetical protein